MVASPPAACSIAAAKPGQLEHELLLDHPADILACHGQAALGRDRRAVGLGDEVVEAPKDILAVLGAIRRLGAPGGEPVECGLDGDDLRDEPLDRRHAVVRDGI